MCVRTEITRNRCIDTSRYRSICFFGCKSNAVSSLLRDVRDYFRATLFPRKKRPTVRREGSAFLNRKPGRYLRCCPEFRHPLNSRALTKKQPATAHPVCSAVYRGHACMRQRRLQSINEALEVQMTKQSPNMEQAPELLSCLLGFAACGALAPRLCVPGAPGRS